METLKERLQQYYLERESDFDPDETKNVLEILDEYDDDLSGLSDLDGKLLIRLIGEDETELIKEVESKLKVRSVEEELGMIDPFEDS